MAGITTALSGDVRAQQPEADLLRALSLAARAVGKGGNIVLLDSGVQTVPPLDFRRTGMLTADPDDVATYLAKTGALPDLTGRRVLLSGIGDTAVPQESLDEPLHKRLVAIWTKIVQLAGAACVAVNHRPNTAAAVNDVPAVTRIPLPKPKTAFAACGTTKLGEEDHVGFLQGTATFREPDKARATLRALADTVRDDHQRIDLTGTTSSEGGGKINIPLSKRRAMAVRDVLVSLGVDPSRITVRGLGSNFPGFVPDTARDGRTLLPDKAPLNRKVVVSLACS
jgi:OmpA-OmpF porin, OOP family